MTGQTLVVLVHDVGRDRSVWDGLRHGLDDHCTTVAYDLIGHGQTPPQVRPLHIDDLVRQLRGQISSADATSATIVGHGLGGLVALALAISHPSAVDRLVLLSTPFRRSDQQREAELALLREPESGDGEPAALDIGAAADEPTFLKMYRIFATVDADLSEGVPGIPTPALVIVGADDPSTPPAMATALAGSLPGSASSVVIDGCARTDLISDDSIGPLIAGFLRAEV